MKKESIWRTSPYCENSEYKEEITPAPGLKQKPDYSAFSSKFSKKNKYVVAFPNISKDINGRIVFFRLFSRDDYDFV